MAGAKKRFCLCETPNPWGEKCYSCGLPLKGKPPVYYRDSFGPLDLDFPRNPAREPKPRELIRQLGPSQEAKGEMTWLALNFNLDLLKSLEANPNPFEFSLIGRSQITFVPKRLYCNFPWPGYVRLIRFREGVCSKEASWDSAIDASIASHRGGFLYGDRRPIRPGTELRVDVSWNRHVPIGLPILKGNIFPLCIVFRGPIVQAY